MPVNARRRRAILRNLMRLHANIAVRAAGVRSAYSMTFGVARCQLLDACWRCSRDCRTAGEHTLCFRIGGAARPACGCISAIVQLPDSALAQLFLISAFRRGSGWGFAVEILRGARDDRTTWLNNIKHIGMFCDSAKELLARRQQQQQ